MDFYFYDNDTNIPNNFNLLLIMHKNHFNKYIF